MRADGVRLAIYDVAGSLFKEQAIQSSPQDARNSFDSMIFL
jgi:hypothetical protein